MDAKKENKKWWAWPTLPTVLKSQGYRMKKNFKKS